jgi:hypothetical protein
MPDKYGFELEFLNKMSNLGILESREEFIDLFHAKSNYKNIAVYNVDPVWLSWTHYKLTWNRPGFEPQQLCNYFISTVSLLLQSKGKTDAFGKTNPEMSTLMNGLRVRH